MQNFLKQLVDSNNKQIEAHLVMLCLGVLVFILLSIYHIVVLKQIFDPATYGQGLGCLLAGGGAASLGQGLQRKAEGNGDESAE